MQICSSPRCVPLMLACQVPPRFRTLWLQECVLCLLRFARAHERTQRVDHSPIMQALIGAAKQALQQGARGFAAASASSRKVAVLGAAGGIGQPLGLLMKASQL